MRLLGLLYHLQFLFLNVALKLSLAFMSKPFTASNIAFNEYHEQIKCGIDSSVNRSFVMKLESNFFFININGCVICNYTSTKTAAAKYT